MFNTLNVSLTGLNAAKIAVENVSNNIANENTPGYKKRVVQLDELAQMDSQFTGRGVGASSTYRITSQYMYDKLMTENTKTNYYEKLSDILGNVESLFEETEDSGLSSDINRYFQAIENLRSNPNSEIYKSYLRSQGQDLVDSIDKLYSSIEKQQFDEKQEFYKNVDRVNDILTDIGSINQKIMDYSGVNNDLLDKRDKLELELSNYVDIKVNRSEDFYELRIGNEIAINNNTNVRTIEVLENEKGQIDKFNHIKYNSDGSFQVYDSMKYNDDYTDKNLDDNDIVTFRLNNDLEVSVTIGESLTLDWDGDGTATTEVVTKDNLTRAMVYKINSDSNLKGYITAYNGDYSLNANGEKVSDNSKDNFLRLESLDLGVDSKFETRIFAEKRDNTDSSIVESRESIVKNTEESSLPYSQVSLGILDKEFSLKSGIIKAQVDNLSSISGNNKYQDYLDKLDSFVATLSDVTDKYIKVGNDEYIYGENLSRDSLGTIIPIGLFSGTNVKTFKFNESVVDSLSQNELDYLGTIQWKKDLNFDNKDESTNTSFLEYIRNLKVTVSTNKEDVDFFKETQSNVEVSIQNSYDQLTKVDKDEEMLNLIKFQAAYTANAKIITAIDEMLDTLLGLKR